MNVRLTAAVMVALFAAGCSTTGDDVPSEDPSSATSGSSVDDSNETDRGDLKSSKQLPPSCEIDDTDVAVFSRDWGRVAGAVGRPDIRTYTTPLAEDMQALAERAEGCPGAKRAARLAGLLSDLDEDAKDGTVEMDSVNEIQTVGNAWLKALGYGENALPTG